MRKKLTHFLILLLSYFSSSWTLPSFIFEGGETALVSTGTKRNGRDDVWDCSEKQLRNLNSCNKNLDAKTKFLLYTRPNEEPEILEADNLDSLTASNFHRGKELKVLIHGYKPRRDKKRRKFPYTVAKSYLNRGDELNVIVVDWSEAANIVPYYSKSAGCARPVATRTAQLLQFLVDQNYTSMHHIHVIGHSLGAHVAGQACSHLGSGCRRITGLDPARPCFRRSDVGDDLRLDRSDAHLVDVIHTDGDSGRRSPLSGGYGLLFPMGHVDFYPNKGMRSQPNCYSFVTSVGHCSHSRAHKLYEESVRRSSSALTGRLCGSWEAFQRGDCVESRMVEMGDGLEDNIISPSISMLEENLVFLRTDGSSPYGLGVEGANPKTK